MKPILSVSQEVRRLKRVGGLENLQTASLIEYLDKEVRKARLLAGSAQDALIEAENALKAEKAGRAKDLKAWKAENDKTGKRLNAISKILNEICATDL